MVIENQFLLKIFHHFFFFFLIITGGWLSNVSDGVFMPELSSCSQVCIGTLLGCCYISCARRLFGITIDTDKNNLVYEELTPMDGEKFDSDQ